jgi:uncharacterized protein YjiS (DUF1127 family)
VAVFPPNAEQEDIMIDTLRTIAARLREAHLRRRTRLRLAALDAHLRRDIGIADDDKPHGRNWQL